METKTINVVQKDNGQMNLTFALWTALRVGFVRLSARIFAVDLFAHHFASL